MDAEAPYDVVVVGSGAAGLSAALAARESLGESGRVLIVERSSRVERGGNTRWTGAYLRLKDPYTPADGFLDDAAEFAEGHADIEYWRRLIELLPETMEWLQAMGLRFNRRSTSFVTTSRPRLLPDGGGEAIVRILGGRAEEIGIDTIYESTADGLTLGSAGEISGVRLRERNGKRFDVQARAVVIASGGFEGNQRLLAQYYGNDAFKLRPIAPGGLHNKGEGIRIALEAGARADGQWDAFHAEPMDPRSSQPAPTMLAFPYGIVVNQAGRRFVDEGQNTVDENYERVARAIRQQPGSIAFLIADQRLWEVSGVEHAINTDLGPITGDTVAELARNIGVPAHVLEETVADYNRSLHDGVFKPRELDGLATQGLAIPKSNWARAIGQAPFVAYPMACAVVFTFGGIGTNLSGQVVTDDGVAIPGLYAAGECTGIYYGKYLGATSVLRSLVYGRVSGLGAAACSEQAMSISSD